MADTIISLDDVREIDRVLDEMEENFSLWGVPTIRRLRAGVSLEGRLTSPAEARLVRYEGENSVLVITIHEGRNRQVRRMVEAIGHEVTALRRIGFGPIRLEDLPRGMWRRLTPEEIRRLKEL